METPTPEELKRIEENNKHSCEDGQEFIEKVLNCTKEELENLKIECISNNYPML